MESSLQFNLDDFIGREDEYNLFKQMLDQVSSWRILAFQDMSGMGKTCLLRKLESHCRKNNFPVCLISLTEKKTPIEVINEMRNQLRRSKLLFSAFDQCEDDRNRPSQIVVRMEVPEGSEIKGEVNLDKSNFEDAQYTEIVGAKFVTNVNASITSTTGQQQRATERSLLAFLDDLRQAVASLKLVILLDDYTRNNSDVNAWLFNQLVPHVFLDRGFPSSNVCLVTAGEEAPPYKDILSDSEFEQVVHIHKPLSPWTRDHMRQYLERLNDTDEESISTIALLLKRGRSLRWIDTFMRDLAGSPRRL